MSGFDPTAAVRSLEEGPVLMSLWGEVAAAAANTGGLASESLRIVNVRASLALDVAADETLLKTKEK